VRPAYRSGEAGKEARLRMRTTVHRARRAGGVFVSGPGAVSGPAAVAAAG